MLYNSCIFCMNKWKLIILIIINIHIIINNIRKGLQIVSKKYNNLGELQKGILIGFSTVTLFSGSLTGVHSYKMGKNFNEIAKNTLIGMQIGATTFIFAPIVIYDLYKNCV